MPDLSRIGEREKLKPKAGDEPHWQRLRQGVYLGYRPSKKKAGGTWFARFYDAEASRNSRKRLGDYALRGWRRGRVYPDFVFAVVKDGDGQRLVALESKGDQLDNRDTAYKAKVLAMLSDAYSKHASADSDELGLESTSPDYQAALVLFGDMDAHLPTLIQPPNAD